jgi:hypothetical protein
MKKIDKYFKVVRHPYTNKPQFNKQKITIAVSFFVFAFIFYVIFLGSNVERKQIEVSQNKTISYTENSNAGSIDVPHSNFSENNYKSENTTQRQYNASQIVKNGLGNSNNLPMGSTIPVRLVNTAISSENAPVIAEVMDDVLWKSSVVIPIQSRIFGQSSYDDTHKRLNIKFSNVVFPEGQQYAFSGLAMMSDGSAGLSGEYSSGRIEKQIGNFIGSFVGGLAEGVKDKQVGSNGIAFEPGSLKNGILNGIRTGAFNETKTMSDEMKQTKGYLEIKSGLLFLIYLDKEYGQ